MAEVNIKLNTLKQNSKWQELHYFVPITQSMTKGNEFLIKGIAINQCTTKNGHKFLAEELRPSAETLRGKPLLKDHENLVDNIVGRVTQNVIFDEINNNIPFEANVMDKKMREMINDGRITSVSVGAVVKNIEREGEGANEVMIARGIEFVELSLVAVPADPNAGLATAMCEAYELKLKNEEVTQMAEEEKKPEETPKEEAPAEAEVPKEDNSGEEAAEKMGEKLMKENSQLKVKSLQLEKEAMLRKVKEQEDLAKPKEEVKVLDETKGEVGEPKPAEEKMVDKLFIGNDKESKYGKLSMFYTDYEGSGFTNLQRCG